MFAQGYTRKKYGKGFQYFDSNLVKLSSVHELKRIKALAIPPMWQDVNISRNISSKVQATGRDAKGRKQYIYSEKWNKQQQKQKFLRLVEFAKALPAIRLKCHQMLDQKNWEYDKVIALMVMILDKTGIRIGNQKYTEQNNTFGLSTLRRKHLTIEEDGIELGFTGKSNKQRLVRIDDPLLAEHIMACAEQPGYQLFRYRDSNHSWEDISSEEVNGFIKQHMGDEFSCKDFRTWNATCLALDSVAQAQEIKKLHPRKNLTNIILKLVSQSLGNTPAVCKTYYVHPSILEKITNNQFTALLEDNKATEKETNYQLTGLREIEKSIIKMLSPVKD